MPRKPTGKVVRDGDHFKTRIRLPDGTRPWIHLPAGLTEPAAVMMAIETQRMATAGELAQAPAPSEETVSDWCGRYFKSLETKGQTSVRDNRSRFKLHIEPIIGQLPIRSVTRAHVEQIRDRLDRLIQQRDSDLSSGISAKTAANIWVLVTSIFRTAQNSKHADLRVRDDNPALNIEGPDDRDDRARTYLYPDELRKVLTCEAVPMWRRRAYALACYIGARKGELSALTKADVDLKAGTIHVHQAVDRRTKGAVKGTKAGKKTRRKLEPAVIPLLEAMIKASPKRDRFVPVYETRGMADDLREDLERAKVTRAELFADTATQAPISFHDLRGTFATWCALRGDSVLEIRNRLSHSSVTTTERYMRDAEVYADLFGQPFPPIPSELLTRMDQGMDQEDSQNGKNTGENAERETGLECVFSAATSVFTEVSGVSTPPEPMPNGGMDQHTVHSIDPIEAALAAALEVASRAGEWGTVGQLAGELEARRRARSNVVDLSTVRRGRGGVTR